ncbi:hypothetical protein A7X67_12295 [Clostridium sp. W14A]|nr:hypothetical protein A7X67_12295 [Clostridium sp. W14A]
MKPISDKNKKLFIIIGLGAACVLLAAVVATQYPSSRVNTGSTSPPSQASSALSVSTNESSGLVEVRENTDSSSGASSSISSSSAVIQQAIQPDPVKPSEPASQPKQQKKTKGSSKTPSKSSGPAEKKPQGGAKNSKGQTWFPGFGWVDDGGENTGTTVGSSGDELTGHKVGSM